jgi:hypothetical protein
MPVVDAVDDVVDEPLSVVSPGISGSSPPQLMSINKLVAVNVFRKLSVCIEKLFYVTKWYCPEISGNTILKYNANLILGYFYVVDT